MPKFDSPITNKTVASAPLQEFSVPDESQGTSSIDFDTIDKHRIDRGLPPLDDNTKRAMYANQMQNQAPRQVAPSIPAGPSFEELEQQIAATKKAQYAGNQRLNDAARKRIDILCGVSRGTREVDIDGNKYSLRTLKGKEHRAAIVAAAEWDGSAHAAFEIRKQLLARAIVQVTGYDLGLFVGDNSIEARLEFVDELEEPMLNKLYSEYLNMVQETQNKYFPQTETQVKEVMEDLKK